MNHLNQHALSLRTLPLSRYVFTPVLHVPFVFNVLKIISVLFPQSSMGTGPSSSATASTQFQSGGSYGLFNRPPVPTYNQFGTSPLVSPQFGAVGIGEYPHIAY